MKFRETHPHAFADWAIQTGRLGLNCRAKWLARFDADPDFATAEVLLMPPTREPSRPCPIFSADPRVGAAAKAGHQVRLARRDAISDVVRKSTAAIVTDLGYDVNDPDTQAAVKGALRRLAETEKADRRRARRVRAERIRRAQAAGRISGVEMAEAIMPDVPRHRAINAEAWRQFDLITQRSAP